MTKSIYTLATIVLCLLQSFFLYSQAPNEYRAHIKNIQFTDCKNLEFEVWIEWHGSNTQRLQFFQAGINFNYAGLANGGTITGAFVPGSADALLPPVQHAPNWNINASSKQIRLQAAIATPASIAATVPASPGLRMGKFKITNTVNFTTGATPNFTWSFNVGTSTTTQSRIAFYLGGATTGTDITQQSSHIVVGNPVFNTCTPCNININVDQTINPVCKGGNNGSAVVTLSGPDATSTGTYSLNGGLPVAYSSNPFTITGLNASTHLLVVTSTQNCFSNNVQFTINDGIDPSDGNACTDDVCDSVTGAVSHSPVNPDDGIPCTTDGCDSVSGVFHNGNCTNSYAMILKNIQYTDCRNMEFEVWLNWQGTNTQKFLFFQAGINFNYAGLANGGTITGVFVPGSADPSLPPTQQVPNWNINATSKQIRLQAAIASPSSIAAVVPPPPGFRLGTFRITNSADFTFGASPNFSWQFLVGTSTTTQTRIAFYLNGSTTGTDITQSAFHTVESNPAFTICSPCGVNMSSSPAPPVCLGNNNGSVTISLSGDGAINTGTYSLDGGPPIPYTTNPFTVNGLAAGTYSIMVTTSSQCVVGPNVFTLSEGINPSDGSLCTTDACNSIDGSVTNIPIPTDDGNACTTDGCNSVTGFFHVPFNTFDGNACTIDGCNSITGVFHTPVDVTDNNACTNDACNSVTGVISHTAVNTDDSNACTIDDCNSLTGLITHVSINVEDGNDCTIDQCNTINGSISHSPVDVDDGNACTIDNCNSLTGLITHTNIDVDDVNACTIDECNTVTGSITHTAVITNDQNACTIDGCNSQSGIFHHPVDTDDANACTLDGCDIVSGVYHNPVNIDDGNACTIDDCNTDSGLITHTPVAVDDGDACTVDECNTLTGTITHPAVETDDQNACTTDGCDSLTGIFHNPVSIDDGNACTIDDCDITTGVFHTPVTIDDGNPCTNDACDTSSGVITHVEDIPVITAVAGEISCYGGNTCVTVTAIGGTTPYSGTGEFCGYSMGEYSFDLTDARGCIAEPVFISITEPSKVTVTATSTSSTGSDGTATAVAGGGTPGYSYLWIPTNQSTNPATGLPSGSYSVTVTDDNGCTANATVLVESACDTNVPGSVVGPSGACRKQSGVVYCTTADPMATSYNWTLPAGVVITGNANGPCITVKFTSKFKGGFICVNKVTPCGISSMACKNVVYISKKPHTPGIISGTNSLCPNSTSTYSVSPVANASGYLWTTTGNISIISGQGTSTIVVSAAATWNGGNMKVRAINCKGNSGNRTLNISRTQVCREGAEEHSTSQTVTDQKLSFSIYPNPASGKTTVSIESEEFSNYSIVVTDVLGNVVLREKLFSIKGVSTKEIDMSNAAKGIYLISLYKDAEKLRVLRLLIQ